MLPGPFMSSSYNINRTEIQVFPSTRPLYMNLLQMLTSQLKCANLVWTQKLNNSARGGVAGVQVQKKRPFFAVIMIHAKGTWYHCWPPLHTDKNNQAPMDSNPSTPPPVATAVLFLIWYFSSLNYPFVKFALSCPQMSICLDPDICIGSLPFQSSQ